MKKTVRKRETCPTCKHTTTPLEQETYCDICGKQIKHGDAHIDCICSVAFETLGNEYDGMEHPDLCSLECLCEFMTKVTQLDYISITLYDPDLIESLRIQLEYFKNMHPGNTRE